jgi:CobQ-like glutamine amidotransferase family enzyme
MEIDGGRAELRIAHLYPDLLNIYADRGNIIALSRRCQWRGIRARVDGFGLGQEPKWDAYDIFYISGGQDREQNLVCRDLAGKAQGLIDAVEEDAVLLAICGGYQLLGDYYRAADGGTMEGVGLFRAHTTAGSGRLIGNVVIEASPGGVSMVLAGFENHAGRTCLDTGQRPLGRVLSGHGNNGNDGGEGIIYRNAVGTYLHGPLLPKNTAFTDFMLAQALRHRYGAEAELEPLDDTIEEEALRRAAALSP